MTFKICMAMILALSVERANITRTHAIVVTEMGLIITIGSTNKIIASDHLVKLSSRVTTRGRTKNISRLENVRMVVVISKKNRDSVTDRVGTSTETIHFFHFPSTLPVNIVNTVFIIGNEKSSCITGFTSTDTTNFHVS